MDQTNGKIIKQNGKSTKIDQKMDKIGPNPPNYRKNW